MLIYKYISFDDFSAIIEPSAGSGSFSDIIPKNKRFAYDLVPMKNYIQKQDFLKLCLPTDNRSTLVLGNPPFGYRAQLAVDFFNKAATISNTIAFILPKSFRKSYVFNQLNLNFHLKKDISLDDFSFVSGTSARCCFQIWKKENYKRQKQTHDKTSTHFDVLPQGLRLSLKTGDFGICRTSHTIDKVGKIVCYDEALPKTQYIFIRPKHKNTKENFEKLKPELEEIAKNTVLSPTFSVGEMVETYNKKYDSSTIIELF